MIKVENLTDDPFQQMNLVLPNGSTLFLQLLYRQTQQGWFINQIQHPTLNHGDPIYGMKLCNSGNLLRQFKNIINFGLAVYTTNNREPSQVEDLATGATTIYLMNEIEVEEYEQFLRAL